MTITLTWQIVMGFIVGLGTLAGAITACSVLIANVIGKLRSPEKKQNDRLDRLEQRMEECEKTLKDDRTTIDEIEQIEKITLKAVLSLLRHGISGNAIDKMEESEQEINNFLLNGK